MQPRSPGPGWAPRHGHGDYTAQCPLHAAARAGEFRKIHEILGACDDPAELGRMLARTDADSDVPLHACLAKEAQDAPRAKKCMSVLLGYGADADAVDKDSFTALHACALRWDEPEIIGLLLSASADPDIKDRDAQTPLDSAEYKGHDRTVELLRHPEQRFLNPAPEPHLSLLKQAVEKEKRFHKSGDESSRLEAVKLFAEALPWLAGCITRTANQRTKTSLTKKATDARTRKAALENAAAAEVTPVKGRPGTTTRPYQPEPEPEPEPELDEGVPPGGPVDLTASSDREAELETANEQLRMSLDAETLRRERAESQTDGQVGSPAEKRLKADNEEFERQLTMLAHEKSAQRERADTATNQVTSDLLMSLKTLDEKNERIEDAETALREDRWLHPNTIVEIQGRRGVYVKYKRNRKGANKHIIKFNDTGEEETRLLKDLAKSEKKIVTDLEEILRKLEESEHSGTDEMSRTRSQIDQGIEAWNQYRGIRSARSGSPVETADGEESQPEQLQVKALFTTLDQVQQYRRNEDGVTAPEGLDIVAALIFSDPSGVESGGVASSLGSVEAAEVRLQQLQEKLGVAAAAADQEEVEKRVPERNEARRKFLECVRVFGADVADARTAAGETEHFIEKLQGVLPAPELKLEPEPEPSATVMITKDQHERLKIPFTEWGPDDPRYIEFRRQLSEPIERGTPEPEPEPEPELELEPEPEQVCTRNPCLEFQAQMQPTPASQGCFLDVS